VAAGLAHESIFGSDHSSCGFYESLSDQVRNRIAPIKFSDRGCFGWRVVAGYGWWSDSVPESEYRETIAKAGALAQAIELADAAFGAS